MDRLLQILLEEAESEERSLWYSHGYEIEERALQVLAKVIERAQRRLSEEN